MAVVNPQTFFRFAADHHALLVELYQHRDGITEAELLQLVRQFAGEGSPSASYIVDRLRELGFIDYAPHATAQYEMTRPFAELMSSLLREYRLTSVEVIRGYFTAMDSMAAEIGEAIAGKNGDLMVRALNDTAEHVERMRHDSRRNRDEVISTAMRVKSNKDRMPPMRRYEIINRLWTRYLVPLRDMIDIPPDWDELSARYRKTHAEEQSQAEQVRELLDTIERRTYGRYTGNDESGTIQALRDQLESIPQREKAVAEMWKGIAVGIKKDLQNIGRDLETLKGLVGNVNRQLAAVSISNLASLRLLIEEWPQWVKLIREVTVDDELPLFSNPKAAEEALEGIGRLLSDHPRVDLKDLFNLSFEVGTPDGKTYRHEHLDAIESNGTTMAIKVLVNLVLLRGLLGRAEVQIPFYLDECSSLDQGNLKAIVSAARQMGFVAVLASPDAMDAADKLYFIEEQDGGRVVLNPRTAMVRIQRETREAEVTDNA